MNYIRGVANAISAPYLYYKELPPINPSTLTGAIDVIVIQRPLAETDGETELACSPFHVRFGKWQVLRPGEKKVNVSVNEKLIPYYMKIGDAGEAFFVFETDEDVPEDLITSPILQPTTPSEAAVAAAGSEVPSGLPGEQQDREQLAQQKATQEGEKRDIVDIQEPEYLDLDAQAGVAPQKHEGAEEVDRASLTNVTPKQTYKVPSFLKKSASLNTLNQQDSLSPMPSTSRRRTDSAERTPEMEAQDKVVDDALHMLNEEGHLPEVEYHHDLALDMEGYHSGYHERERSDQTVKSSGYDDFQMPPRIMSLDPSQNAFPPQATPALQLSTPSTPSGSEGSSNPESVVSVPAFRATSEPPPDTMEDVEVPTSHPASGPSAITQVTISSQRLQVQEYSWEWGGFPQPSPVKATFSKSGRLEGPRYETAAPRLRAKTMQVKKGRLGGMQLPVLQDSSGEEDDDSVPHRGRNITEKEHGRSHSVPAGLQGTPSRHKKLKRRQWKEYEDFDGEEISEDFTLDGEPSRDGGSNDYLSGEERGHSDFGIGGTLNASKGDPTKFILSIEGRRVGFQLSIVPPLEGDSGTSSQRGDDDDSRGRKSRDGSFPDRPKAWGFDAQDDVEAARLFQRGLVDFDTFLNDESVVSNPHLVIRWVGVDQYITRNDGSPLMDALVHWREAALHRRAVGQPLRPLSPYNDGSMPPSPVVTGTEVPDSLTNGNQPDGLDLTTPSLMHARSKSEPPEQPYEGEDTKAGSIEQVSGRKPTSLSWVQWWSRSRRRAEIDNRPMLTSTTSLPLPAPEPAVEEIPLQKPSPLAGVGDAEKKGVTEAEPGQATKADGSVQEQQQVRTKKFAKTLRLTSDQLKALDLHPGANTITFSLSATGAVAATARIFVWDYTDHVVVSDIDGTITKSDGLGHVFAMLGRDWTHLGVAKLYTDITRNGYKIMYLTSRAIGQADATRGYLKGIKQNNYQLPEGPVIMSPDRLMASLHREVIMRKPEVFKMACLRDIQRLFGDHAKMPFYAGFGNRITDALSYRSVNIPSARIFTIDSSGEVKMELLELAGYKSSYIHMTDLVDQMFPPIHRKWTPEFTDFNYWRAPVQDFPLPDFSPPSPALSARSDTSNQSALARLRNFSLGGSRHRSDTSPSRPENAEYRSSHLRQMSSLEKLSSTLGFMTTVNSLRRSVSPEPYTSYTSDEEDEYDGSEAEGSRRRPRRRSMTSMPGSLNEEDMHFEEDEEESNGYEDEDVESDGFNEEDVDEAFDEDLLAAGEMQKVPFL